jgi:L-ascorbate metabolism protein UlaG (beta-lactamase superfamily)
MLTFYKRLLFVLAILFLAVACGLEESAEPATSVPVAARHTSLSPAPTPLLTTPTAVLPTLTASAVPPTVTVTVEPATPTPTPVNLPPLIAGLVDQVVPDDERFPWISLDEYVEDPDHLDEEIVWSLSGAVDLRARILTPMHQLRVDPPTAEWRGSETIHVQACDPQGLCDGMDIVFTILDENDAPVVHVRDQFILRGQAFSSLALDELVSDVDNTVDEIAWSYSGNTDLSVSIADRVLAVDPPYPDWHGREIIQLVACDPEGACGSADIEYAILADSDVLVTFTSNAGFLIVCGGKKILIDALYPGDVASETLALMENARPPFDGVDLVLATHDHYDHFGPASVGRHLEANPKAVFVSTESAVDMLRVSYPGFGDIEERVVSIQLPRGASVQETVNGIDLEILNLPHGPERNYTNLGFVISLGDRVLFHTGDSGPETMSMDYFLAYDLPSRQIDVAFVAHFILQAEEQHPFITEGIQARYLIPMHYLHTFPDVDFEIMEAYFPDAIVFHGELESWLMPLQ